MIIIMSNCNIVKRIRIKNCQHLFRFDFVVQYSVSSNTYIEMSGDNTQVSQLNSVFSTLVSWSVNLMSMNVLL